MTAATEKSDTPIVPLTHTVKDAAAMLGVNFRTLYNLRSAGKINFVKIGRAVRITTDEIHRILREGAERDRVETQQGTRQAAYAPRVEKRGKSKGSGKPRAAR